MEYSKEFTEFMMGSHKPIDLFLYAGFLGPKDFGKFKQIIKRAPEYKQGKISGSYLLKIMDLKKKTDSEKIKFIHERKGLLDSYIKDHSSILEKYVDIHDLGKIIIGANIGKAKNIEHLKKHYGLMMIQENLIKDENGQTYFSIFGLLNLYPKKAQDIIRSASNFFECSELEKTLEPSVKEAYQEMQKKPSERKAKKPRKASRVKKIETLEEKVSNEKSDEGQIKEYRPVTQGLEEEESQIKKNRVVKKLHTIIEDESSYEESPQEKIEPVESNSNLVNEDEYKEEFYSSYGTEIDDDHLEQKMNTRNSSEYLGEVDDFNLLNDDVEFVYTSDAESLFSNMIKGHKILSEKEQAEWADIYINANGELKERAANMLFQSVQRLNAKLAHKYARGSVEPMDLQQEGNILLHTKIIPAYDASRNMKFSSYAAFRLRSIMIKYVQQQSKNIYVPVHVHQLVSKIRKTASEFETYNSRKPTNAELADILEMNEDDIVNALDSMKLEGSLNKETSEGTTVADYLPQDQFELPEEATTKSNMRENIMKVLNKLSEQEKEIIMMRFALGEDDREYTLQEIGDKFGVTRERIRQIEKQAIKKLQNKEIGQGLAELNDLM